jgi:hypothetical protein
MIAHDSREAIRTLTALDNQGSCVVIAGRLYATRGTDSITVAIRIVCGEQSLSNRERCFRIRIAAEEPRAGQRVQDVADPEAAGSVNLRNDVSLNIDRRFRRMMHFGLEGLKVMQVAMAARMRKSGMARAQGACARQLREHLGCTLGPGRSTDF